MTERTVPCVALLLCASGLMGCGARSELEVPHIERKSPRVDCIADPAAPHALVGRIRDFSIQHPDFEHFIGDDRGIVRSELDASGKPIYAGLEGHPSTSGKTSFDEWYRDTPNANVAIDFEVPLTNTNGEVGFHSDAFFPIDGQALGNEGMDHNYAFTFESQTDFRYKGGEQFEFRGDDDVFVFVAGHAALDLGGVHPTETGKVIVDDVAAQVGLDEGSVYTVKIFFAERHSTGSTFHASFRGFDLCAKPQ